MIHFVQAHPGEIFGLLFAISELMALIPGVESNGIFQLVYNFVKSKAGK